MPSYHYKAIDKKGSPTKGQLDAINEVDLEIRLARMELDLITFKVAHKSAALSLRKKVSNLDLVMFCFQLEQLISAGVPMLEGLQDMRSSIESPYFQKIMGALVSEIESGKLLSQALAIYPEAFNEVFVSLVVAGEKTGRLPMVLEHLATTLKWQDELFSQTKRLLAYPLFVMLVVLVAVAFLMIYLVPQMVAFLHNMGQELPFRTRLLIAISQAFVSYWWLMMSLPMLLVAIVTAYVKTNDSGRYQMDYIKLNLPVTGEILQKIIMARFARYFGLMYQTGIPVLDAIKTCEKIVANRVIAEALRQVHQQITAGKSMSESFKNTGLFPPLVVRMIKVGESTGALDKALINVSYFYDRDVNEKMQKMLKLLEPLLTVVLGLILAFIMSAVLGPVYDSFSQLKI